MDASRGWLVLGSWAAGAACAEPSTMADGWDAPEARAMQADAEARRDGSSEFIPGKFPDEPGDAGARDAQGEPEVAPPPPEPPALVCRGGFRLSPLAGFESYTALGGSVVGMDADGSGYVLGEYSGALDLGPSALADETGDARPDQANHGFVAKFDPECRLAWVRRLGPASAAVRPLKGALDERGRLFVAGTFEGVTPFQADTAFTRGVFVSRLDGDGNIVFTRSFASHREAVGADVLDMGARGGVVVVAASAGEDADFGAGAGQFGEAYGHGGTTVFALSSDGHTRFARPLPGAFPVFVAVGAEGHSFIVGRGEVPQALGIPNMPPGARAAFMGSFDSRGSILTSAVDDTHGAEDAESSREQTLIGADQTHDWARVFPAEDGGARVELARWTTNGVRLPDLTFASPVLPHAGPHVVGNNTSYWVVGAMPQRDHCQVFTVARHDSYGTLTGSLEVEGCSTAQVTGAVSGGAGMLAFTGVVGASEGARCDVPAESYGFVYARVVPP